MLIVYNSNLAVFTVVAAFVVVGLGWVFFNFTVGVGLYICSSPYPAYYMVVATEDNTLVDIHYSNVTVPDEQVTLNQYEVFTRNIDGDFTGTRVVADKAISVYSGALDELYADVSDITVLTRMPNGKSIILLQRPKLMN